MVMGRGHTGRAKSSNGVIYVGALSMTMFIKHDPSAFTAGATITHADYQTNAHTNQSGQKQNSRTQAHLGQNAHHLDLSPAPAAAALAAFFSATSFISSSSPPIRSSNLYA